MERRTERIVLAPGAIAQKYSTPSFTGGKSNGMAAARHQMLQCEPRAPPQALRTIPVCDPLHRVVKDRGMPTHIAGRAQGERAQMTALDVPANATAIHMHVEAAHAAVYCRGVISGETSQVPPISELAPIADPHAPSWPRQRERHAPIAGSSTRIRDLQRRFSIGRPPQPVRSRPLLPLSCDDDLKRVT